MDLATAPTRRQIKTISASHEFIQTVREFANDSGMTFSETVRHLCRTGLANTTNIETLREMRIIKDQVSKMVKEENKQIFLDGDNHLPTRKPNPAVPDNLSDRVKKQMGLDGDASSVSDKEGFESLYG